MATAPDYDIVVVGSGAAGLSAAISAADGGASVLVVEADTRVGGSSRLSGGHFYAAGTSLQKNAGVQDSAEAMFEHYMTLNQWRVEASVVRRYCDLSAPTFEWLQRLGVEFPDAGLYRSGVGSTPRGHQPGDGGEGVIQVLDAQCQQRGIDMVFDSRVDGLVIEDGHVCGVRIGADSATCDAVILATGGFGANPELLASHYPDTAANGDWQWYIGSEFARGDGLQLGQEAGGQLAGHNRGLLLATPGFSRDLEVLLPGWLIAVNEQGRRFMDETGPYTVAAGLIQAQGGRVWAIFDEPARADAKPSPVSQAYWVNEVLQRKADEGFIHRADSLSELADLAGVDPAGLAGTIATYNEDCTDGTDRRFFKSSGMRAITTAPFYAAEIRPAILCWTGTGLNIDADTQVLGRNNRPIPGLYAAGETVGSLHGDVYVGGGGSFGPCIVFGKLAGTNAALFAQTTDNVPDT